MPSITTVEPSSFWTDSALRPTGELAALEHNLGGLAHSRSDLPSAERHTRRAIELRHQAGGDPLGLAAERGQLATIMSELGDHHEAEDLVQAALATFVDELGPDHLEVAIARTTLGAILHRAGRPAEAAAHYREGLRLRERMAGPEHPELAPTLVNLARLLEQQGQPAEATKLLRRAVTILDGAVEPDHPRLTTARARLHRLTATAPRRCTPPG